ncbi:hypothetical protein [Hymenobacter crusticola]|uniref:Uncharacterized protein n=1 Tax=Hymenobacter crusticola TaxID=1770526 RepID=A0A243WIB7_9BACT|nr:hypothetical protein [Hymenobacter crusticola]OUJ75568.1 hypothetical protein BXP70_06050 [Hymenobacter crusticola]
MMPKIHTKWLGYMTSAVLFAASLTSCNRAEYAMLPKTSSYHGTATTRAVAVAPVAPEAVAPAIIEAAPVAAPVTEASSAQVAPVVAAQPASTTASAQVVAPSTPAVAVAKAEVAKPTKTAKLNLVQKAMVQKVMKKADKLASKMQIKQKSETADAKRLSGNLRTGIILLLIGLLVSILGGISWIFGLLGGIIAIIGVVLIILGLLDEI